jgi:glycosyltransferase involved in cell wall biosynthesis
LNGVAVPSVLIDVSRLVGRLAKNRLPTGVDRVCLAYVERFGANAQAVLQWRGFRRVVPPCESLELFSLLGNPGAGFLARAGRIIARTSLKPFADHPAGAFYLNVGHTGLEYPGLAQWLHRTSARGIFMVHDLIPITHPEYCRPGEAPRHEQRMQTVLRTASGVVANSHATLESLNAFAAKVQLALPKAVVAPLGPAELALPGPRRPLPAPYFVILGTIEPRKNHLLLLNVWRRLVSELGEHTPHLVIIGQRGWECENVVDLLERCAPLRGVVHELGRCSDSELTQYLLHARALLFPSFAEGFGLPLVEALRLGTPAIASPLPVFQEIAGAVPDYVDALDGPAWAQAIRDYASGEHPRRIGQLERLRGFRGPTWNDHFDRVDDLLEMIS